jgi:hypothetical protein
MTPRRTLPWVRFPNASRLAALVKKARSFSIGRGGRGPPVVSMTGWISTRLSTTGTESPKRKAKVVASRHGHVLCKPRQSCVRSMNCVRFARPEPNVSIRRMHKQVCHRCPLSGRDCAQQMPLVDTLAAQITASASSSVMRILGSRLTTDLYLRAVSIRCNSCSSICRPSTNIRGDWLASAPSHSVLVRTVCTAACSPPDTVCG